VVGKVSKVSEVSEVSEEVCSGKTGRLKIKITNYKIQIKNKSQITMSKITNSTASMHPCNHMIMQYHPHSSLFPIFLSSQLPSFPLYPLAAGGKNEKNNNILNFTCFADVFGCHGNIG
jgi:hypothetical protein